MTRRMAGAVLVVVLGLVAGACGGGSGIGDAAKNLKKAGEIAKNLGKGNKELDAFVAQAEKAQKATFRAEYTIKREGQADTSLVLVQKPPKSRFASLDEKGQETNSIINDGKDTFTCFTTDSKTKCLKAKGEGGAGSSVAGLATLFNPAAILVALKAFAPLAGADLDVKSSNRSVAGQSVACVTVTDKTDKSAAPKVSTYCTTKDGVFAVMEDAQETVTLSKYSTSVSDGEFEIKGEIVSDSSQLFTPPSETTEPTSTTETTETTSTTETTETTSTTTP